MQYLYSIPLDESFFVLVAFLLFLALSAKYVVPPVGRLLDKRADEIERQLEEATKLREEAQTHLAQYQKRQREMLKETEAMLDRARVEAETMKVDAEAELKEAISRRMNQAKDRIARAEEKAMKQLQDNIVEISITAAENVIREHIEAEGDEELITLSINDADRVVH